MKLPNRHDPAVASALTSELVLTKPGPHPFQHHIRSSSRCDAIVDAAGKARTTEEKRS